MQQEARSALAACFGGCSYLHDRVNDLLDPFRVDVGFGPGLYADVRATDFLAVGAGGQTLDTVGIHGRFIGTGRLGQVGLPGLVMFGEMRNAEMTPLLDDTLNSTGGATLSLARSWCSSRQCTPAAPRSPNGRSPSAMCMSRTSVPA